MREEPAGFPSDPENNTRKLSESRRDPARAVNTRVPLAPCPVTSNPFRVVLPVESSFPASRRSPGEGRWGHPVPPGAAVPPSLDPADLSPAERADEVARLLAAALLRLPRPIPTPAADPESRPAELPGIRPGDLEVSARTSVTVHGG